MGGGGSYPTHLLYALIASSVLELAASGRSHGNLPQETGMCDQ